MPANFTHFGLGTVPFDKEMTRSELDEVLKLTLDDIPGSDIFSKMKGGALRSPAQQLVYFDQRSPDMNDMRLNVSSRRLNKALPKESMRAAICVRMVQEAVQNQWLPCSMMQLT